MNYSEETDYYAILKVSVDADGKAIKRAYRKQMKELHPDRHKIYETTEEVATINAAHDVLGDPEKKSKYDRERETYFASGSWMDLPEALSRLAYWSRHRTLLKEVMVDCKHRHFSGEAELFENDYLMRIPADTSLKLTLPNSICQGNSEAIGICCHDNQKGFIVAMYLRPANYVAVRGYLAPEDIYDSVYDCIMEVGAIKNIYLNL